MNIPENARRFLERPNLYATVATLAPDGSPHQAVAWYVLRDDGVVVNTSAERQWGKNLRRDPRASISVEDGLESVSLRGEVELVDDHEQAQADIAELARRYAGEAAEEMIENHFRKQRRISFVLRPARVHVYGLED